MWTFETEAWNAGYTHLAGIDEVGRGPLAGPVVACAVLVPLYCVDFPVVNDSKKLSAAQRQALAEEIQTFPGLCLGLGIVSVGDIDRLNILRATHLAMRQALEALPEAADFALVDGRPVPGLPVPSRSIIKGDGSSAAIAAASIVAKVYRDNLMAGYDKDFPGYGFAAHKGYGTKNHLTALKKLGPCPIHRVSFAPVRRLIEPPPTQLELDFNDPKPSH